MMNYRLIGAFAIIFLFSALVSAAPFRTTYQAKIIKPDGQPLQASSVNFRFTILDPTATCILYVEDYSAINMHDSGGLAAFSLGAGVRSFPTSGTSSTFSAIFDNSTTSFSCQTAGVYLPVSSDIRKIVMQFNDGTGWQSLQAMTINAVPYSMYASKSDNSIQLNGKSDTAFVEYSTLAALNCQANEAIKFNGVSFSCLAVGGSVTSGSVITALGYTPADGASVTALTSSLSSTDSTVSTVSSTIFSVSSTVSSLAGVVSSLQSSVAASFTAITNSQWSTSGTTINYTGGNVGIGTTTPVTKLDVSGGLRISMEPAICAASFAGTLRYNASNIEYCNGTSWQAFGVSGAGINNFNGSTSGTQSFATGTGGTAPNIVTANGVHTLNIPLANMGSVTAGLISNADYTTFSNKITSSAASIAQVLGYVPANDAASGTYAQKANNLSDLTNIATARTNLGLGTFATASSIDLGSASATGTLDVARLPSFTGDATIAAASNTIILSNSGVTAGTYTKITVDAKGRVTSGAQITSNDVTTALGYTPANSATIVSSQWNTSGTTINYMNGNVGIGTTAPANLFHVEGPNTVAWTNTAKFNAGQAGSDNAGSYISIQPASASGRFDGGRIYGGRWNATASGTRGLKLAATDWSGAQGVNAEYNYVLLDSGNNSFSVNTNNAERLRIDSSGNIGIGTTTPAYNLDIDVKTADMRIKNTGAAGYPVQFMDSYSDFATWAGAALIMRRARGTEASPTYVNSGDSLGYIAFRDHLGGGGALIGTMATEAHSATAKGTALIFQTNANTVVASTEKMRIDHNGNVGIGTTAPTASLHLKAGTTTNASLKFTSGTLLTSPQSGTMEYDGANFYLTDGTNTRRTIATGSSQGSIDNVSNINSSGNITLTPTGSVIVSSTTASTNSQTGALVVKGGLGVAGNIYASGSIVTSSNIQGSEITATSATITPFVYGSTVSGGVLTLDSTTHSTKGNIILAPAGGNVGIGTANPLEKFVVGSHGIILHDGGNKALGFNTEYDDTNLWSAQAAGAYWGAIVQNPTTGDFQIASSNVSGGATTNAKMTIRGNGNVGIGTTNPAVLLDLQTGSTNENFRSKRFVGSNSWSNIFRLYQARGTQAAPLASNNGDSLVTFSMGGYDGSGWVDSAGITAYANGTVSAGSIPTDIAFTTGSSGGGSERMRILSDGNVGIGTTAPSSPLQVNHTDPSKTRTVYSYFSPNFTANHSANLHGIWGEIAPNSSFDMTGTYYAGVSRIDTGSSQTGAINAALGFLGDVYHDGAGSIDEARGLSGNVSNRSAGAVTNARGGYFSVFNTGSGTIATGFGVYIGTVHGTTNYGVYQADSSADNYFAGNVGIGTTSPATKFHIAGQARVDGSLLFNDENGNDGTKWGLYGWDDAFTFSKRNSDATFSFNATYMTIKDGGNVGIGTATPSSKLHVSGTITADGLTDSSPGNALYVTTASTTAGPGSIYMNDSEAKPMFEVAPMGPRTNYSWLRLDAGTDTLMPHIGSFASATNPGLSLGVGAIQTLNINSAGNVGISTTSPNYLLDVNGSALIRGSGAHTVTAPSYGGTYFSFDGATNTAGLWSVNNTTSQFAFYTKTGNTDAGTERMRITQTGNVGIGTTNPAYPLHIEKNTNFSMLLKNTGTGDQCTGIITDNTSDPSYASWMHTCIQSGIPRLKLGVTNKSYGWVSNPLEIDLRAPTSTLYINNLGNVGIGTTGPSEKLHVVGNLRVQGSTDCTLGNGAGGTNCSSDARLKENIKPIPYALEKVISLKGVEFDWNSKSLSYGRHDIGVIAQDIEKVFPTAVMNDKNTGYKKVDYAVLVAPLIEAVKSLYYRIVGVESDLSDQKRQIASIVSLKADKAEIEALKQKAAEVDALKVENADLKNENSSIKAYLCSKDPTAPFCK